MGLPTPYSDLNDVLRTLVRDARDVLQRNFWGAYLQGSFAIGDADAHSDVDFVIATRQEVEPDQLDGLQAMHERLHALPVSWAQHLEGSYFPINRLRTVDAARAPLLYLDNGATRLVWDNHCNTAVVRWTLREHGVVLAGPDPKDLVDPVSAAELRSEARTGLREYAAWAPEPTKAGPMSRWKQPYLVLTFCRLLHTLEHGTVVSKREAGEWAREGLAPEWASLIQAALDDRPDPWGRVYQVADLASIERTLDFAESALAQSNSY